MDTNSARTQIDQTWDESILPELVEYVRIPNKSIAYDRDWEANGHMERAVQHMRRWAEAHAPTGSTREARPAPIRADSINLL